MKALIRSVIVVCSTCCSWFFSTCIASTIKLLRVCCSLSREASADRTVQVELLVMVGQGGLELVGGLLVVFPRLLTVTLLLGQALVLVANSTLVLGLPLLALVFQHTAHAKNSLVLLGIVLVLLSLGVFGGLSLTHLLVSPLALELSILKHAILVHYRRIAVRHLDLLKCYG